LNSPTTEEKLLEQIRLKVEQGNCTAAVLVCRDEKTNEKVLILYSK
jgi:hypothetical protein